MGHWFLLSSLLMQCPNSNFSPIWYIDLQIRKQWEAKETYAMIDFQFVEKLKN